MQGNAELVKLYRDNANQRTGEEAFQDIDGSCFYTGTASLRFNRHIEYGDCHTCHKQRPAKQGEQVDHRADPTQVEDLGTHVVDAGEQVSYRFEDGGVDPLDQGCPDGIHHFTDSIIKCNSDGIA